MRCCPIQDPTFFIFFLLFRFMFGEYAQGRMEQYSRLLLNSSCGWVQSPERGSRYRLLVTYRGSSGLCLGNTSCASSILASRNSSYLGVPQGLYSTIGGFSLCYGVGARMMYIMQKCKNAELHNPERGGRSRVVVGRGLGSAA